MTSSANVSFRQTNGDSGNGSATIEPSVPVGNSYTLKVFHDLDIGWRLFNNTRLRAGRLCFATNEAHGHVGATSPEDVWELWAHFARRAGIDAEAIQAARPFWEDGSSSPTLVDPSSVNPSHKAVVEQFRRTWDAAQRDVRPNREQRKEGYLLLPERVGDQIKYREYPIGLTAFAELTYKISTFPTRYGLGKTIGAITLLPGEEQEIRLKTWQTTSSTSSRASSMFDSFDSSTKDSFQSTLDAENQSTLSGEEKLSWNVQAEVSASFLGMASAKVAGGASGESKNAIAATVRSASKAVQEHAAQANASRKLEVTTKVDQTSESGREDESTRRIKNVNLRRTLNFVFRELNQTYETIIHLVDVRVGLRSGLPGDFVIGDLKDGNGLFNPSMPNGFLREGWSYDLERAELLGARVMHNVVRELGTMFDDSETLVAVLESMRSPAWEPEAHEPSFFRDLARADEQNPKPWELATFQTFWRFRRNVNPKGATVAERDAINQEGRTPKVAGLVVNRDEVLMKTQSMITEALLGAQDALDAFAMRTQEATVAAQELGNQRIQVGLDAVASAQDKVTAYSAVFNPPPVLTKTP